MNTRNFWYLFSAQTISAFGDYFGLLAIEWLMYELTGSKLAMGALAMAFGIPEIVVRFAGAPLIDRVNRIRLMAGLDVIRGLAFAMPAFLGLFGMLEEWHLYATAIMVGTCSALFNPSSMAVVPSLLSKDKLVRGISLLDTSMYAAVILGPSLAGVMIATFGAFTSLWVDAGSYLLSAFCIYLLSRTAKDNAVRNVERGVKAYAKETLDGLRFFKYAPALLLIMSIVAVKNMSSLAVVTMTVPYGLEILHTDAAGIGMLSSATAVGLLCGGLMIAWIGDMKNRRLPMLGSVVLQGLLYVALSFTANYWVALVVFALIGLTGPFFGTFSSALYGQMVPEELRGRVMSARLLVGGSLQPAGSYLGGAVSQVFGIPLMFLFAGLLPALLGVISYFLPVLKGIDGDVQEVTVPKRTPHKQDPSNSL